MDGCFTFVPGSTQRPEGPIINAIVRPHHDRTYNLHDRTLNRALMRSKWRRSLIASQPLFDVSCGVLLMTSVIDMEHILTECVHVCVRVVPKL